MQIISKLKHDGFLANAEWTDSNYAGVCSADNHAYEAIKRDTVNKTVMNHSDFNQAILSLVLSIHSVRYDK